MKGGPEPRVSVDPPTLAQRCSRQAVQGLGWASLAGSRVQNHPASPAPDPVITPPTRCHHRTETHGAGTQVQGLGSSFTVIRTGPCCPSALPWAGLCGPGPAAERDPGCVHRAPCARVSWVPVTVGSKACFPEPAAGLPTWPPASPTAPGHPARSAAGCGRQPSPRRRGLRGPLTLVLHPGDPVDFSLLSEQG